MRPPSRMLEPKWGMEEWRYERRSGGTVDSWMRCGNNIHPGTVYMSECVSGRGYEEKVIVSLFVSAPTTVHAMTPSALLKAFAT